MSTGVLDPEKTDNDGSLGGSDDVRDETSAREDQAGSDTASAPQSAQSASELASLGGLGANTSSGPGSKGVGGAASRGLRSLVTRKNSGFIGGFIGLILSAALLGMMALGPGKFLQLASFLDQIHFSDQELVAAERLRNMFIYSKYALGRGEGLEKTRLGIIANKHAATIDKKLRTAGLVSDFDSNGTFRGFKFDISETPEDSDIRRRLKGVTDNTKRNQVIAKYYNVDPVHVEGSGTNITIKAEGTRNNRKLFATALKQSTDYPRSVTNFYRRILIKRANLTYNPFTRSKENFKRWTTERVARLSGSSDIDVPDKKLNGSSDPDTPSSDIDKINTANNEAKVITNEARAGRLNLGTKLGGSAAAALAVMSAVCTVREVADSARDVQILNKLGPMMQASNEILTVASKIQAGEDIDIETIEEINKYLETTNTTIESEKSSWEDASSIMYEDGFDISGRLSRTVGNRTFDKYAELNPDGTTAVSVLDGFFESINKIPGLGQSVSGICGAFSFFDNITGAIVNSIPGIGDAVTAISDKLGGALMGILAGKSVDLTQLKYAGEAYGEALNVGTLVQSNEAALALGGRQLNEQEASLLKEDTNAYIAANDETSLLRRSLDPYRYDSVAGRVASALTSKNPAKELSRVASISASSLTSLVSRNVSAADTGLTRSQAYYGIPKVGFNLSRLNAGQYANPYSNAEWIAERQNTPAMQNAITQFEACSDMDVTGNFDFVTLSYPDSLEHLDYAAQPDHCKQDGSEELYRLRLLALDTGLEKGYSCLELADEQSCNEIYGVDSTSSTSTVGNVGTGADCATTGITEPADNYTRITRDGKTINQRTDDMLKQAETLYGKAIPRISQGSYNAGGVAASKGTHDGGGVIDIGLTAASPEDRQKLVIALRKVGFAAWLRTPSQGFAYHIHANAIGDKEFSSSAAWQVREYFAGRDGLAGKGPDTHPDIGRPIPEWALQYGGALCPR